MVVHEASYGSGGGGRSAVEWVVVLRVECASPSASPPKRPVPEGLLLEALLRVVTAVWMVEAAPAMTPVVSGGVVGGMQMAARRAVVLRVGLSTPSGSSPKVPAPAGWLLETQARVEAAGCGVAADVP